jgi:competence protein ComFB
VLEFRVLILVVPTGIFFATISFETLNVFFYEDSMDCNVRNANYERVLAVMDKILERYKNLCTCKRCINDIAALALNYLPPHYYADEEENREIGSPWVMVETAVVEAIDRVMENPNHPGKRHHSRGSSAFGI